MIDYQIKIEEQKDLNRKHIANAVLERHTSNPLCTYAFLLLFLLNGSFGNVSLVRILCSVETELATNGNGHNGEDKGSTTENEAGKSS